MALKGIKNEGSKVNRPIPKTAPGTGTKGNPVNKPIPKPAPIIKPK